jgi:hypothetical protein
LFKIKLNQEKENSSEFYFYGRQFPYFVEKNTFVFLGKPTGIREFADDQSHLINIDKVLLNGKPINTTIAYGAHSLKILGQDESVRFQKRVTILPHNFKLDYSKGNYIDTVGLSQSNVDNDSNLLNKFSMDGGNILNQFLKK